MPTSDERRQEPWREVVRQHMSHITCLGEIVFGATSHADLWARFTEFVAMPGTAHRQDVFTYAWWCVAWSEDAELASAARACFYEVLPTCSDLARLVPIFVPSWQFERLAATFRRRLTDDAYNEFRVSYYGTSNEPDPPQLWRELALEHMPALREAIGAATDHCDLWWTLKVFVAEEGPKESSRVEVASIFSYAWWCVMHSKDACLSTAVETFFYEDLPAHTNLEPLVSVFIAPWQFQRLEAPFRYLLTDGEYDTFRDSYYASIRGNNADWGQA